MALQREPYPSLVEPPEPWNLHRLFKRFMSGVLGCAPRPAMAQKARNLTDHVYWATRLC